MRGCWLNGKANVGMEINLLSSNTYGSANTAFGFYVLGTSWKKGQGGIVLMNHCVRMRMHVCMHARM
jgi:hypothetical protein